MGDAAIKRDEKGRLLPGHGLKSPGRPKRETERAYLSVMIRLCPPKTWATICERAVEDALAGDDKARAFLAKYLLPQGTIDGFTEVDAGDNSPDA